MDGVKILATDYPTPAETSPFFGGEQRERDSQGARFPKLDYLTWGGGGERKKP